MGNDPLLFSRLATSRRLSFLDRLHFIRLQRSGQGPKFVYPNRQTTSERALPGKRRGGVQRSPAQSWALGDGARGCGRRNPPLPPRVPLWQEDFLPSPRTPYLYIRLFPKIILHHQANAVLLPPAQPAIILQNPLLLLRQAGGLNAFCRL